MYSYYVKIENNSTDYLTNIIGEDRSSDSVSSPTLSFNGEKSVGGNKIYATENIVYDTVAPLASYISLSPSVNATAQIRTVSSTSVKGSEISFTDIPYQDIELNRRNYQNDLPTPYFLNKSMSVYFWPTLLLILFIIITSINLCE